MTTAARAANRAVLKPWARFLATTLVAMTLGAVLAGARVAVGGTPESDLRIEPATLAVGDLSAGARKEANLRIRNVSSRRLRVVGMERVCSRWGCCDSSALPITIEPSASGAVPVELKAKPIGFTGGFAQDVMLYTDSKTDGRMVAHLVGRVVPNNARRWARLAPWLGF